MWHKGGFIGGALKKYDLGFVQEKLYFKLKYYWEIATCHLEDSSGNRWEETCSSWIKQACQTSQHPFRRICIFKGTIWVRSGYLCLLTQACLPWLNLDFVSGFFARPLQCVFFDASPGKQPCTCCLICHGIIVNLGIVGYVRFSVWRGCPPEKPLTYNTVLLI